jgi:argininosuccinate lyase
LADAMIAGGATAREAHAAVGERVLLAERQGRALDASDLAAIGVAEAPLDAEASIRAKRTSGSPNPGKVARSIDDTQREIDAIAKELE